MEFSNDENRDLFFLKRSADNFYMPPCIDNINFEDVNDYSFNYVDQDFYKMSENNISGVEGVAITDGEERWIKNMERSFNSNKITDDKSSLNDEHFEDFDSLRIQEPSYSIKSPKCFNASGNNISDIKIEAKASNSTEDLYKSDEGKIEDSLYDYISQVIENGMKSPKVRAGRPKQEFDTSE